jgi:four helix bundle protein
MNRFKELKVWQESMDVVIQAYELTKNFPKGERYGLTNQIRRSSVSIPSNIAEGSGRNSAKDFSRFLSISNGSASELVSQLELAVRLKFILSDQLDTVLNRIDYVQNMIYKLQELLKNQFTK